MTQKEIELVLIDLCSRVPYHPKGHVVSAPTGAECDEWLTCATFSMFTRVTNAVRLYLRPMSSMTEEEKKELGNFVAAIMFASQNKNNLFQLTREALVVDFLNKHHFDYRGLIEKGLALEAPKGMYNVNEK